MKHKWNLYNGKELLEVFEADFIRMPFLGILELCNRVLIKGIDDPIEKAVPVFQEIVAVVVLGPGQYISMVGKDS